MTTYKIYSTKDQGSYKKGELILSQSATDFEKHNDKFTVENFQNITNFHGNRVRIEKV